MRLNIPKKYYCDFWKVNYEFCLGWPEKMIKSYMTKHYKAQDDIRGANAYTWHYQTEYRDDIIIWTADKEDLACLAHECVHAANLTLLERGCKPDLSNDEPQAYTVENIFRKATE